MKNSINIFKLKGLEELKITNLHSEKIRHQAHKTKRRLQILNQSSADCCPHSTVPSVITTHQRKGTAFVQPYGQLGTCCFKSEAHNILIPFRWAHNTLVFATIERLICPGWKNFVIPVSQPGTPGRDKRGCSFVPGLSTGTKGPFFFCLSFLNCFSISIILLHFN